METARFLRIGLLCLLILTMAQTPLIACKGFPHFEDLFFGLRGERPVGPESFVGNGLDGIKASGEKLLHLGLVGVLREEPLAFACAPLPAELIFTEEDLWRVRPAGAPEKRGTFAEWRAGLHDDICWLPEEIVRVEDD